MRAPIINPIINNLQHVAPDNAIAKVLNGASQPHVVPISSIWYLWSTR